MYWLRRWSVRHARALEITYDLFERSLQCLSPLAGRIGHERLEKPVAAVERLIKGALFDCQMCGQCVLNSTGMSCPMNCPKTIRNGPCGGVREGGFCEVEPQMRCVWVEAWQGAANMKRGEKIAAVQFAVDNRLYGRSSWLRVLGDRALATKSDTTQPAVSTPSATVSTQEISAPGTSIPGTSIPGTSIPGTSVPGTSIPMANQQTGSLAFANRANNDAPANTDSGKPLRFITRTELALKAHLNAKTLPTPSVMRRS